MVTIAEAQPKDSGWYQCTAFNQSGSTATRARIQVEAPARDWTQSAAIPAVKLNIPHTGRVILPEYVFCPFLVCSSLFYFFNVLTKPGLL
jgi:hypothetical protein